MELYRKLLYNDDCILEIDSNKLYFDSDKEYENYKLWAIKYPKLEEELLYNKNKQLRWNQGVDEIIEGVKTLYHLTNGSIYLQEYYDDDEKLTMEKEFYDNGKLASIKDYSYDGETIVKSFTTEGTLASITVIKTKGDIETHDTVSYYKDSRKYKVETVQYNRALNTTATVRSRKYIEDVNNTLVDSFRVINNKTLQIIYTQDGYLHSKKYTVNGNDRVVAEYWPTSNDIFKLYTYYSDDCSYSEFYANKLPRAKGKLNKDKQMQGEWIYYHNNGEIESTHTFNKGKLVGKSKLFFEDGTLNNTFTHG